MAAGRQGVQVGYVSPIKEDSNGDQFTAKRLSLNVRLLGPRVSAPTSWGMMEDLRVEHPPMHFTEKVEQNGLQLWTRLIQNLTGEVAIFHIGSLALIGGSDASVREKFVGKAMDRGVKVSLDPNVRLYRSLQNLQFIASE